MEHQFKKHFTLEEARTLLPQIRKWLERAASLRRDLTKHDEKIEALAEPGKDLGGPAITAWIKTLADFKEILLEFHRRDIQVKDLDRGLIDFPAIIGGREVFMCWEQDEDDVEFWHDLNSGYAGRERL